MSSRHAAGRRRSRLPLATPIIRQPFRSRMTEMANRYQTEDRWRRDRAQRGYGRQAEQFQSDYDERYPSQMGESWRDDEAQQSAWQSDERYDREYRGPAGERYENERFGTAGYGPSRYTPGSGR